mgnify:CR=1 FL=1
MAKNKLRRFLEGLGLSDEKVEKAMGHAESTEKYRSGTVEGLDQQIAQQEELVGILRDEAEITELKYDRQKLLSKEKIKDAEHELEIVMNMKEATADQIRYAKLQVKIEKNRAAQLEKSAKVYENITNRVQAITGVSDSWKDSGWGSMLVDAEKGFDAIADSLSMENLAGSTLEKGIEATLHLAGAQDEALVAFNASTGASKKYGDELLQLESDMFQFGVSMEVASEAMTALVTNVYKLESFSGSARKDIEQTTALLSKFGVSADTSAKNIDFLTVAMGESGEEAAAIQRSMFATAQAIGRPPAEMAEAFQASTKLYVNASKAGMKVDELLSITEKFDTFAGAADQVGKLNAMLGGPFLNSMEMVTTTDPTERMKMLSDAVNSAGVSFDDMGYYQRKAMTEAMGLSDVSELAKVMAGDFDEMAGSSNQSSAEILALADQAADFTTIMDEMKEVGRLLAMQVQPLVKIFKSMLTGIQKLNELGPVFSSVVMGIAGAMLLLKLRVWAANFAFVSGPGALLVILTTAVMLFLNGGTAMKVFAAALAIVTLGLWAFNAAIAASGFGAIIQIIGFVIVAVIGLIAWLFQKNVGASTFLEGLVKIGHAFFEMGAGMLFAVSSLYLMGPALLALILMTGPLALAVLPGGAFWSLSTGLGWVADALTRMDTSKIGALTRLFTALAEVTREAAENIALMGAGVAMMAGGFAVMSVSPMAMALAPAIVAGATGTAKAMGKGNRGMTAAGAGQKLLPLTVKVELEGKELAKFVRDVVVKELNYNKG